MNYSGSFRKLLGNSKAAMIAAIEIYNKPSFEYRDEVFVQLLINAWELLLKAMVSKAKRSIYYKKERGKPYRTLSWSHALNRSKAFWPKDIPIQPVVRNLELIGVYRDNAVHFYNEKDFGVLVYSLAQTAITNYCDLLQKVFGKDFTDEISWTLMPLGLRAPVEPLAFLSGVSSGGTRSSVVEEFLTSLKDATAELDADGIDTGRLLTIFDVSLQSTKKIEQADIVIGVKGETTSDPVLVNKVLDPNRSHPYRRKEALERIGNGAGGSFNSRSFDAVVWRFGLRDKKHLCWVDETTGLTKWSPEVVTIIKRMSATEIQEARSAYTRFQKSRSTGTSAG